MKHYSLRGSVKIRVIYRDTPLRLQVLLLENLSMGKRQESYLVEKVGHGKNGQEEIEPPLLMACLFLMPPPYFSLLLSAWKVFRINRERKKQKLCWINYFILCTNTHTHDIPNKHII